MGSFFFLCWPPEYFNFTTFQDERPREIIILRKKEKESVMVRRVPKKKCHGPPSTKMMGSPGFIRSVKFCG